MSVSVVELCWPIEQLGECVAALAASMRTGGGEWQGDLVRPVGDARAYVARAAEKLGCESELAPLCLRDLEVLLRLSAPAVVQLSPERFLAVVRGGRNRLTILTASGKRRVDLQAVCAAVREPFVARYRKETAAVLADAGLRGNVENAVDAVLRERTGAERFDGCWTIRPAVHRGWVPSLGQGAVVRNAVSLVAVHLVQYLIWLLAWTVLGRMSLSGRVDPGGLLGWALLLVTTIPFQLLATWLQGLIAVGTGGLMKRRLLVGALRLRPDDVREGGIGTFLAQAIEAGAVESLALGGGIAGLLSIIDLVVAGLVLGSRSVLLLAWFGLAVLCGWRFLRSFAAWSAGRFRLTGDLIEKMVGHRTRLTQEPREDWHRNEDGELARYHEQSRMLDRAGAALISLIPRGWLMVGLASTMPMILAGGGDAMHMAVSIGGVLLAFNAFGQLVGSFSEIAAALVAWKGVAPLFTAAKRREEQGDLLETPKCAKTSRVLEAERLTFRYRPQGAPVLDNCKVAVKPGDRILLEGPSGGGKTTLASLLSGMRHPETGLLLSGGLDRATLGAASWAERVISVPQFHENHILTETLAFNLLLGRAWPPSGRDLQAAEEVCQRLGLGGLLDRMPNRLLQMVGEGGWQLSHGEKTRIFMARALLQDSELLILDESFGALDPENMQRCLEYTLERSNALMVIAHP